MFLQNKVQEADGPTG